MQRGRPLPTDRRNFRTALQKERSSTLTFLRIFVDAAGTGERLATVKVRNEGTGRDCKIAAEEAIGRGTLTLSYHGWVLEDVCTILASGLHDKARVFAERDCRMYSVTVSRLSGDVVAVMTVPASYTGVMLKRCVANAGGPFEEHQKLLWQDQEIKDEVRLDEFDLPADLGIPLLLIVDVGRAFVWEILGGVSSLIQNDDRLLFKKGSQPETVGVRAAHPLPRDASWRVQFCNVGSHSSLGVCTGQSPLSDPQYCYLFGMESATSWALCFGESGTVSAHGMTTSECLLDGESGCDGEPEPSSLQTRLGKSRPNGVFDFILRRRNGRELAVLLPGEGSMRTLFSDLPENSRLYAVASTNYGGGTIFMEQVD